MQHTMSYSVGGKVYNLPSDQVDGFLATAKQNGDTPEEAYSYRVSGEGKEPQEFTIPKSEFDGFQKTAEANGDRIEPVRTLTMADGTSRSFTMKEMGDYLRSDEYRKSKDYADSRAKVEASVPTETTVVGEERGFTDELNAAGGGAIGRTAMSVLSGIPRAFGWLLENANGSMAAGGAAGPYLKSIGDPTQNGQREVNRENPLLKAGDWVAEWSDILFPEVDPANGLQKVTNKGAELGSGLAKFGIMASNPMSLAALVAENYGNSATATYDTAIAGGNTPEDANALAQMRGFVDGGITLAFAFAPVKRLAGVLGLKTPNVVAPTIAVAVKEGANSAKNSLSAGIAKAMAVETMKTATEMGALSFAQGMLDDAIRQEAENPDKPVDWIAASKEGLKEGGEQAALGAALALLPTPVRIAQARKRINADMLDSLNAEGGTEIFAAQNPKGAEKLIEAYAKEGSVSRKVAESVGLPEMNATERNSIAERLTNDFKAREAEAEAQRQKVEAERQKAEAEKQKVAEERRAVEAKMAENEAKAAAEAEIKKEEVVEKTPVDAIVEETYERIIPKALGEKGNELRFKDGDTVSGVVRVYNPGITTKKQMDVEGRYMGVRDGKAIIVDEKGRTYEVNPLTLKTPEERVAYNDFVKAQSKAISERMREGIIPAKEVDRLFEMTPDEISKAKIDFETKKVADGRGRMVKEEPSASNRSEMKMEDVELGGKIAKAAQDYEWSMSQGRDIRPYKESMVELVSKANAHDLEVLIKAAEIETSRKFKWKKNYEGKKIEPNHITAWREMMEEARRRLNEVGKSETTADKVADGKGKMVEKPTIAENPPKTAVEASEKKPVKLSIRRPKEAVEDGNTASPANAELFPPAKPHEAKADKVYKSVSKFVSKDGTRDSLMRELHTEDGKVVATDGRVLIETTRGWSKDKVGENPNYPNYKQVIPDDKYLTDSVEVNPAELVKACKEAKRLARSTGQEARVYLKVGKMERVMDADNMLKIAEAMDAEGMTTVKTGNMKSPADGAERPLPITIKNGDTVILGMPLRVRGNDGASLLGDSLLISGHSGKVVSSANYKKSTATGQYLTNITDRIGQLEKFLSDNKISNGTKIKYEKELAKLKNGVEAFGKIEQMTLSDDLVKKLTDTKTEELASPAEPQGEAKKFTIEELDKMIAAEEAGESAGGEGKAEGLPSRSHSWNPGSGLKGLLPRLVSRNSIVRAMKDEFPEFAIRGENTTRVGANYAGHFEPWRELIRSKDMASIDTIPHEIGHGISMRVRRGMMSIPQEAKRELMTFGKALYGSKKPNGGYMEEGFAEYVRGYMTAADNLSTDCPKLDAWFNTAFKAKNPEYVRKMDVIRKEVLRYRQQDDIQRAAAEQRPETSAFRRAVDNVKEVFSQENWNDEGATLPKSYKASGLDSMHEWRPAFRNLEELVKLGKTAEAQKVAAKISEQITSDPRIFASNVRGTSKARVMDMARFGVTNLTGTEKIGNVTGFNADGTPIRDNVTESYRDIFRGFSKKELDLWDLYAAAKVGLENYAKNGKEFGVDRATLERRVRDWENPKFLDALERFTAFTRRALSVGLESGAMTPEQYKAITSAHKYYVRTERRLNPDGAGQGGAQQNPLHAIKGSTKNIMNPRVATMMQIERQLRYFQTMKTLNLLCKDALKAEEYNTAYRHTQGYADGQKNSPGVVREAWAEYNSTGIVPKDFMLKGDKLVYTGRDYQVGANLPMLVPNAQEAVKFGTQKLGKEMERSVNKYDAQTGMNANDRAVLDNYVKWLTEPDPTTGKSADTFTVFREKPSNGKNGLVSTYINGELMTFELPTEKWEKFVTGMEKDDGIVFDSKVGNFLWNKVATAPAKLVRLGATTLNPAFAWTNFMRDTFHSAIMSDTGAKPLASSVVGIVDDLAKTDFGRLYRSMGGEMAMLTGSSAEGQFKHAAQAALADNLWQQVKADSSLMNPLGGVARVLADVLSIPEMGPRVREIRGVMKKGTDAGLTKEATSWLAFAGAKDISIDFGKHGKMMKYFNQLVPYTNAWYRGMEQFARNIGLLDALPTQFENRRTVRAARTAGRAAGWMSTIAVANAIANMETMNEKERRALFNKTDREKWEYDDILGGLRIPMPFELGSVFYAIPKAAVYKLYGDKGALKSAVWHAISSNIGKYSETRAFLPPLLSIAYDIQHNEKWDKSPIVSPNIMNAYPDDKYMWKDYSTTSAAEWLGEKFNVAPAYIDYAANTLTGGALKRYFSPASDNSMMKFTGAAAFRPRPLARKDVSEFYDFRTKAQSHYNASRIGLEDLGRLNRANKLHEQLSPLFKEARELANSGLSADERNKKREEIMDSVYEKIHEWKTAETNDRQAGIAKAAVALTNAKEIEPSILKKNLDALKDVPFMEIEAAIRAYGKEKIPVKKNGHATGRMSRRWEGETIGRRVKMLKKVLNEK